MKVRFGCKYFLIIPQLVANNWGNLIFQKFLLVQNKIENVKWSELPRLTVLDGITQKLILNYWMRDNRLT
jgi:hypothetical protein